MNILRNKQHLDDFKLQDDNFNKWVKLCIQLELVLENEAQGIDIFLSAHNNSKKNQVEAFDSSYIATSLVHSLKQDLCNFENKISNSINSKIENIDLETIKARLKEAKEQHSSVFGINRGRPITTEMLVNHFCIQELSFLLRIDRFIDETNRTCSIDNIKLTSQDYRFIYNLLDYFDLFVYDKDIDNTTKPEDIIEQRYKHPPLANNPNLKFHINDIITKIDDARSVLNEVRFL